MNNSQNHNELAIKKEPLVHFKDISERFKILNQKYCTNVKTFTDEKRTTFKNSLTSLKEEKEQSITKDLTFHKQLYLFATSNLNVIPKKDFSDKLCECRLCEIEKTRSPFYKCAECKNFYYCQKCYFLCLQKHPHMFFPTEYSKMTKLMQESALEKSKNFLRRQSVSKFNSQVVNKNDLIKLIKYGESEDFEITIMFKNNGTIDWPANKIFIDYTKESDIRKYKKCIEKGCKIGETIDVNLKISGLGKTYPGCYTILLALLQPNSNDKFFGDIALLKIKVEL